MKASNDRSDIGLRRSYGRVLADQSTSFGGRDLGLYNTNHSLDDSQSAVTAAEYGTLQDAYDYFNEALFGGSLPQVLITLQRHAGALGYFSPERFQRRDEVRDRVHEVALNPNGFTGNTDEEILSTLVHEMVHVWQREYGRCGRGRYHNRQWAAKMYSIGLMPSATGEPSGAVTGDHMSHYILENGQFLVVCREFLKRYRLVWESAITVENSSDTADEASGAKSPTRAKFTCPNCGLNAWAKPGALIDCHACSQEAHELVLMGGNGVAESATQMPKLGSKDHLSN